MVKQGIWKYIKSYKLRSVFVKYFLMLVVLLVLPVSTSFFISNYIYNRAFEAEILNTNSNFLSQVSITMDATITDVSNQINFMKADNNLLFFMNSEDESDYISYDTNLIRYLLEMFHINYSYVENVHLYSAKSNRVISLRGGGTLSTIDDNEWYEEYELNHNKNYWISKRVINSKDKNNVITIFQTVKHYNDEIGLIVVNIDMDKLRPSLIPEDSSFESLFFLDHFGNLMFSYGDTPTANFEYVKELDLSKPYSIIERGKFKQTSTYLKSAKTDWYYISNEIHTDFSLNIQYIRRLTIIIIAFTIIFSLIFSMFITYKLFIPLKSIMDIIHTTPSIKNHSSNSNYRNEIAFITDSVSKTIVEINNYETELKSKLIMIKKAQMTALQAQINPHFLYNTIATIRYLTMSLTDGENVASKALSSLGKLFQISLDGSEHFTTVSKETEHVKEYLELQKIRYRGKLDAQFFIDNKILEYKTIKIILQPLVENAIYHGIKPMEGNGVIKISGYIEDKSLIFEISDNGVGMSDDIVKSILSNIEKQDSTSSHIGIYNVNRRLKLIFGEQFGLTIKSKLSKGTIIKLKMPIISDLQET